MHSTTNASSEGKTEAGKINAAILSQSNEDSLCGGGEINGRERQRGTEEGVGGQDGWMKR